jgi:hypothetical protein
MALIVQKTGQRQGNANIRLYQLGNAQYGSGGTAVFHDITSGNNSVPWVTGYSCTTGYDLATGLGSVDANALVSNWTAGISTVSITAPTTGATFSYGATIHLTASASAISPFTVTKVEFYNGTALLGTDTTSPYSYDWTNAPAGSNRLTAKAYDSLGGTVVSAPVAVNVTPPAPTLVAPSGPVATATPTYIWNAIQGATSYTFYTDLGGGATTVYTAAAAGCSSGFGTCSVTPATPLPSGVVVGWIVNAVTAAGAGPWSAPNFTVFASIPATPTLVSPSGTIGSATPTFTWNAVANAANYTLYRDDTGAGTTYTAAAAGCPAGTGTCSVTPATVIPSGTTVGWIVNADNAAGTGPWSSPLFFTFIGGVVPVAPTLISPSGAIGTNTPTFTWNAVADATSYTLYRDDTGTSTVYTAAAAGCPTVPGTCSVTPATVIPAGRTVGWIVNGTNASGAGPWSPPLFFTVP